MTKLYLLPYRNGSKSVKALANSFNCKRLKLEGSRFVHRQDRLVLNWGCNRLPPNIDPDRCINGRNIQEATNKLSFFTKMRECSPEYIPEFTDSKEEATQWVVDGSVIVCRTKLRASSGDGIVIAESPEDVVHAPLYVKYVKKKHEYRVHVFNGEVIDVQRKMRKLDVPDDQVDWRVRNCSNGFIFGRDGVVLPDGVDAMCITCINHLGLDFGAVDVIWNEHDNKAYLLEVNTAPGLEGTTLEKYTKAIEKYIELN